MTLIGMSLLVGFIGFNIGGMLGPEFFAFSFGIIGFLSPSLYILEQIYKEVNKSK